MGKNKSADTKPQKVKAEKKYTRAQAEKALSAGADPEQFTKHTNYHVRYKAWRKMGSPLPESTDGQNQFLATLQGTPAPKDAAALAGYYALIRQRILNEVPVKLTLGTEPVLLPTDELGMVDI